MMRNSPSPEGGPLRTREGGFWAAVGMVFLLGGRGKYLLYWYSKVLGLITFEDMGYS